MTRIFSVLAIAALIGTATLSAQMKHVDLKDQKGNAVGMAMISPAKGGGVNVELDVKANGVLVLRVKDTQSGAVREATLTEAGLYSDAEVESRRAWLQSVRVEVER